MKVILLALFVGIASCSLLKEVENVFDTVVDDVKTSFEGLKTLKEHLGQVENKYIDILEGDIKEYVTNVLDKNLHKYKSQIHRELELAEAAIQKAEKRISDLEHKAEKYGVKETAAINAEKEKIAHELENVVTKVLGSDGKNLVKKVDRLSKKVSIPSHIVGTIIRELTSSKTIQDLRNYVDNMPEEMEEALEVPLKKIIAHLSDDDIAQVIRDLIAPHNARGIFDFFKKVGNWFKDVGSLISDKYGSFKNWVKDNFSSAVEKIKNSKGALTAIAKEFIGHAKDLSKKVAEQALQYFRENKDQITSTLFKKVTDLATKVITQGA